MFQNGGTVYLVIYKCISEAVNRKTRRHNEQEKKDKWKNKRLSNTNPTKIITHVNIKILLKYKQWDSCYSIFCFICMFCWSLFVLLYFFFWPLCSSSIYGFWLPFGIFKLFINLLKCNYLHKPFVFTFVCKFQISGSPKEFLHNESGIDKHDEGFVQTFEVDTKNMAKFEHVFVSVWSVNQVRNIYQNIRILISWLGMFWL